MSTTLLAVWSAMPATYLAVERAAAGAAGALVERVRCAGHDRAADTDTGRAARRRRSTSGHQEPALTDNPAPAAAALASTQSAAGCQYGTGGGHRRGHSYLRACRRVASGTR